jgi:hypothetical protein
MRKVIGLILLFPILAWAAMSDSKAATEAHKLWGDQSVTARIHPWLKTSETKQIGYLSPGCRTDPTFVGEGINTWDAAFAALPPNKGITGMYSGKVVLHAETPAPAGDTGTHTEIAGALTASAIQFLVDNKHAGELTSLDYNPDRTGWSVNVAWDSSTVPDGQHVLCAILLHSDGAQSPTDATMVVVKQTPQ